MNAAPNSFVWYELMTSDLDGAERFYRDVVGWTTQDAGMPGMRYTLASAGQHRVAGLMTLPAEASGPPGWIGYVGVADLDGAAAKLTGAGGSIHRQPADIPGVGRFAIVADPQGAFFVLFQPSGEAAAPPAPMTPGTVGWHELMADEWEAAFAFYAGQFGWTKDQAIPMGPIGTYQLFAAGGPAIGGMMSRGEYAPKAAWGFYFAVPAIDDAVGRVTAGGGTVTNGPMEVPGGAWIIQGLDPQGASFALVAPKR